MELRVRRARIEDADSIAAIYAPFVVANAISFETDPVDAAQMQTRIADVGKKYPWLVADDNGRIAGYVYASQHQPRAAYQWSANVSAYLHPDDRRRGLATQLYGILFGLLRRQGFRSLFAGITLPNEASVALHRSVGMTDVGIYRNVGFKLGKWHDVVWLGLSFDDERPPSGPPIPFESLPQNAIDIPLRI